MTLKLASLTAAMIAAFLIPTPAHARRSVHIWDCYFDRVAVDCVSTSNSCICVLIIEDI